MSRPVDTETLGAAITIFFVLVALLAAFTLKQRQDQRRDAAVARCAAKQAVAIHYDGAWRCWQEVK